MFTQPEKVSFQLSKTLIIKFLPCAIFWLTISFRTLLGACLLTEESINVRVYRAFLQVITSGPVTPFNQETEQKVSHEIGKGKDTRTGPLFLRAWDKIFLNFSRCSQGVSLRVWTFNYSPGREDESVCESMRCPSIPPSMRLGMWKNVASNIPPSQHKT